MNATPVNRYAAGRPVILGLAKVLLLACANLPAVKAAPISLRTHSKPHQPEPVTGATLYLYLIVAAALVLCGGAFAGLTIALMGQVSFVFYTFYAFCAW